MNNVPLATASILVYVAHIQYHTLPMESLVVDKVCVMK